MTHSRPTHPFPSKKNSIQRLCENIKIGTVIDVGVHDKTEVLIDCFPLQSHILFEPVASMRRQIEENYRAISHTLYQIPLSDKDQDIFLIETSLLKDGRPKHSGISETAIPVDKMGVVSCQKIKAARFDSLNFGYDLEPDYLLKIDVDGKELVVLRGFGLKINEVAIAIVECTYSTLAERVKFLQDRNFSLVDLVDIIYYGSTLYQMDAVFVRTDLLTDFLRPSLQDFDKEIWYQLTQRE